VNVNAVILNQVGNPGQERKKYSPVKKDLDVPGVGVH